MKIEVAELGKKLIKLQDGKGSASPSSHLTKSHLAKIHSVNSTPSSDAGGPQLRHPPSEATRHHHRTMSSEITTRHHHHGDLDDSQSSADDGGSGSRYASDSETPRPSRTKKQTSRAAAWQEERDKHGTRSVTYFLFECIFCLP